MMKVPKAIQGCSREGSNNNSSCITHCNSMMMMMMKPFTARAIAVAQVAVVAAVLLLAEPILATASSSSSSTTASRVLRENSSSRSSSPWIHGPHPHRSRRNLDNTEDDTTTVVQTDIRMFQLWEPHEITETVAKWAEHYPNFIRVTTAQDAYGLPTAGSEKDCPFDEGVPGCRNQILLLQDFEAHPEHSESSNRLPELLWSGEVHGNEQVGPTAVLEAAQLLMDAATCEALPRAALKPPTTAGKKGKSDSGEGQTNWLLELERAQACRHDLATRYGMDDHQRRWLARLLTTRRIVIVPTANALGYYQKVREEHNIDPNRDFPYDATTPDKCMQTVAARTLNEIYREHLFQLALTFHGGMEVVGYEWGAPHWMNKASPDDAAQSAIATAYSLFAGGWATTPPYNHGPMNDLVYPVHGGMEDWAYAASWDPDRVIQCQPVTYGGYPAAKTVYDNSTLRVFNMLIETSNNKIPPKSDLGTTLDLLTNSEKGNGHVARNIRLALLSAELVEPYVVIRTVNRALDLSDDVVPLTERGGSTVCRTTKAVAVSADSVKKEVVVEWTVGGALTVDNTVLYFAKWDAELEAVLDCQAQPDMALLRPKLTEATAIGAATGTTQFATADTPATVFAASMDVSGFRAGDRIAVLAVARVDQDWAKKKPEAGVTTTTTNVMPNLGPQSHIVNVRTDPNWHHEKADGSKIIQGRIDWFSVPLTIVIKQSDAKDAVATAAGEEISLRYDESLIAPHDDSGIEPLHDFSAPAKTVADYDDDSSASDRTAILLSVVATAAVLTTLFVGGKRYLHATRKSHRERVREFIQDETAVSPGLQQIAAMQKYGGTIKKNETVRSKKQGYSDVAAGSDDDDDDGGELELGTYA